MSDYEEEEFNEVDEEFEELNEEDDEGYGDASSSATSAQDDEEEDEEEYERPSKKKKVSSTKEQTTKKTTSARGRKGSSDSKKKSPKAKNTGTRDVNEAKKLVEEFLLETNRPWSIINLVENMKGKAGKAVISKALDQLAKKNQITEKASGKQKVFWINQDQLDVYDDDKLKDLENSIKDSELKIVGLKEKATQLEREVNRYKNAPSIKELNSDITKLKELVTAKKSKLELLSTTKLITPEEKQELTNKFDIYFKAWKLRRRWCLDVIDMWCGDSMSMEDLKGKGLEIETDEENGVSLKDMIEKSTRYY